MQNMYACNRYRPIYHGIHWLRGVTKKKLREQLRAMQFLDGHMVQFPTNRAESVFNDIVV